MYRGALSALLPLMLLAAACSSGTSGTPAAKSPEGVGSRQVAAPAEAPSVDPAKFWYTSPNSGAGYFFTSPSGKWNCAILEPFSDSAAPWVGCAAPSTTQMPVAGAPRVPAADVSENLVAPNAIVMNVKWGPSLEPQFIRLGQPYLWRERSDGPGPVLEYGHTLTALGFTCNTQLSGISCREDATGKGFTFSSEGYSWEYTAVAPSPTVLATPPAATADVVVLGTPSDNYSAGYGTAEPAGISTNGLCGNTINDVSWDDWGGPVAVGSGTWCQNSGARSRGEPLKRVTITVSDIGPCQGKTAYRKIQFDSQQPSSIC